MTNVFHSIKVGKYTCLIQNTYVFIWQNKIGRLLRSSLGCAWTWRLSCVSKYYSFRRFPFKLKLKPFQFGKILHTLISSSPLQYILCYSIVFSARNSLLYANKAIISQTKTCQQPLLFHCERGHVIGNGNFPSFRDDINAICSATLRKWHICCSPTVFESDWIWQFAYHIFFC